MQEIKCPNCGELFPIDASNTSRSSSKSEQWNSTRNCAIGEKAIGEQKDREWENKYEKLRYEKKTAKSRI